MNNEKKVIFTIVAKNYLASAITLGKSVQKYCPNCDFIIYLADKFSEEFKAQDIDFEIYQAENFNIPDIEKQTFMYDVVEFSTAIKPYFMLYLMNEKNYSKVVYLDPDIWVMDNIDEVFELLNDNDFVLTPHIAEDTVVPNEKETHVLDRGVFNLGFLAARNTEISKKFLYWWQKRLEVYCFRDDRLFVDQKWIAFLPQFVEKYYVIKSKAYNVADWNYHEREIVFENDNFWIKENDNLSKIKFFHFSGIKDQSPEVYFEKLNIKLTNEQKDNLSKLILIYEKQLKDSGYEKYSLLPYAYGEYSNGEKVTLLHRRLYRKYSDYIDNPFEVRDNSFYAILKKEKLISERKKTTVKVTRRKKKNNEYQLKVGQTLNGKLFILFMKFVIRLFGIEKYNVLSKQLQVATSIDEQAFLVNKYF